MNNVNFIFLKIIMNDSSVYSIDNCDNLVINSLFMVMWV